jgi:hypothetical protein
MSAYSKIRISTAVFLFVLTTSVASAAPQRDSGSDGFFFTISKIVKKIGKVFRPLSEPTFPKP